MNEPKEHHNVFLFAQFGDELEEWADEQSLTRTLELHGKRMQRQLEYD